LFVNVKSVSSLLFRTIFPAFSRIVPAERGEFENGGRNSPTGPRFRPRFASFSPRNFSPTQFLAEEQALSALDSELISMSNEIARREKALNTACYFSQRQGFFISPLLIFALPLVTARR
jgi:hypothetical protein